MPAKWPPRAVGEPTIAIVVDAAGGKDVLEAVEVGVIVMAGAQGNHIHPRSVNRPIG
jgi:hypothetical protein